MVIEKQKQKYTRIQDSFFNLGLGMETQTIIIKFQKKAENWPLLGGTGIVYG